MVVAAMLVIIIIFVMYAAGGPANGTILKARPVQSTAITADKTLAGKYFTMPYPARYTEIPTGPSSSLQSWILVGHQLTLDQESSKLSIVITALPAGGVQEDSAYKLYSAYPALYKLSQASYGHDPVVIAKRSDSSYQQTILWPHGNYLLTISLTAGTETAPLDNELQAMLSHLQWLI